MLESLLGDGFALALAELKADLSKGLGLAEALLVVLRAHAPRVFERDDELRLNAERLTAIVARPAQAPERPRGSLHASSLIVNAEGDQTGRPLFAAASSVMASALIASIEDLNRPDDDPRSAIVERRLLP